MLKSFLIFFAALSIAACSTAQMSYSTKNKKAIAYFEDASEAPRTLDKNGRPNYQEGLELLNKAIEKDPNFWEAEVVAGEFAETLGQNDLAIQHYKRALQINPEHSATGSTYYYLGTLQFAQGQYEDAVQTLTTYSRNPQANPEMVAAAQKTISNARFAIEGMRNPAAIEPVNLGPGVNTKDPEYFPTITVDGKTLLFTRLLTEPAREGQFYKQEDFFVSQLSDKNVWQKAIPMPSNINSKNNEGAPTISADGRSLVFVACADGGGDYGDGRYGKGSCDLFYTKRLGQQWLDPVNLPGEINTAAWETQPSLSADGKTLYFVKGVRGRANQRDSEIFKSTLQADGKWGTPERLPSNINTPYREESVLIHPDGKTLYFSSSGHPGFGGLDIFVTHLQPDGSWSKPENLGYPINSSADENSLLVSADGEIAFFASDRAGGYGDLDLYYFVMPEKFRPTKTLYFDGLVFDADTKAPLAGKFSLKDLKTGAEVVRADADPVTGKFTVSLPVDREYALTVTHEGYLPFSENFNMIAAEDQESVHKDVPLVPKTSSAPVALRNVFFDLDKATLRPESYIELNILRDYLKANPAIKIEIAGHTDTQGDAAKNMTLSDDRAKAVYDYLVAQGIDAKRLTWKGYGETMPIVPDADIEKMSTERQRQAAHQQNRRTEYRVIK